MKITKEQLKQIIKEELAMALDEISPYTGGGGALRPGVYAQNKARSGQPADSGASHGGGGFNALAAIKEWIGLGLGEDDARTLGNEDPPVSVELIKSVRRGDGKLNTDHKIALNNINWAAFEPILQKL